MSWFVRLQLSDYEVMFHESLEGAWLDKVDRRYAWLRRTLVTYEEECQSIFPAEWGIPERVTIQFCNTTRSVSVQVERESVCERERERGGGGVQNLYLYVHVCKSIYVILSESPRVYSTLHLFFVLMVLTIYNPHS